MVRRSDQFFGRTGYAAFLEIRPRLQSLVRSRGADERLRLNRTPGILTLSDANTTVAYTPQ